jgi:PHS family inorganic phosphate transporter-like MFS transporter
MVYLSEWRHLKILIGTSMCWFLLDIAYVGSWMRTTKLSHVPLRFYGINLNTNVVLAEIGFAGKTGTAWHKLFKLGTGNLIITALGFVPGDW